MAEQPTARENPGIESMILTVRGQRMMLDPHLAVIYGVKTSALNQGYSRIRRGFPTDFAFQFTRQEPATLISRSVISKTGRETAPPCRIRPRRRF